MYDMINALFIRHTHAPDCSHTLLDILRLMGHPQQLRAEVLELAGWAAAKASRAYACRHSSISGRAGPDHS